MPILIRDDDTNFFTRPGMLETIHSKAWDKGFKIGLSIVPFQKGVEDVCVPPEIRQAFGVNPRFFTAPYDDISNFNLRLVRQHDMIPIYGQEKIHKFFRSQFIPTFYKRKVAKQMISKFGNDFSLFYRFLFKY